MDLNWIERVLWLVMLALFLYTMPMTWYAVAMWMYLAVFTVYLFSREGRRDA